MSEEVKEIENMPEKAVYQFGEGKNALQLTVYSERYWSGPDMPYLHFFLSLESNDVSLYKINDLDGHSIPDKLYDDISKEAIAVKKLLAQIRGNSMIDGINDRIKEIPQERQRKKQESIEAERRARARRKQNEGNKKNANNALDNFVGTGKVNRLSILRKKIAHDIDETFGTNIEEKKLPNVLKRVEEPMSKIVEKLVSNKKVNE